MAEEKLWITIPEAGRIMFDLSAAASYRAAKRGEIPTIKVGRRYVVPVHKMREIMGLPPEPVDALA